MRIRVFHPVDTNRVTEDAQRISSRRRHGSHHTKSVLSDELREQ